MSGPPSSVSISLGGDNPTVASVDEASASTSHGGILAVLPRGTTLGRYTVLEPVGRGGMGTVYAAYDPQLDRRIALKVLRPRGGRPPRPRDRARLLREAQAMARLSHPNVIAVHDVAESQGEVFVAMEFVDGCTLKQWLKDAPRTWEEIRDVFVAAGQGLAAAHDAGLVHRDFKPDNVLIDRPGRVRVTDFGLARADSAAAPASEDDSGVPSDMSPLSEPLTQVGALVGTPAFMAPEQHARLSVEPRTDQFSFCVALYHALFGQHPFAGSTVAELAAAVTMGQLKEPSRDSLVPTPIRRAVLRGLQRLPDDRWPTMNALLEALSFDPKRRRRRWALAASGVLIAVVAGGGVYATLGGSADSDGRPGCEGSGAAIDGVWNDPRRTTIADAFVATGRPRADAAFDRTALMLGHYVEEWRAESRDACEATRVRGVQSDELLDLRTACLQRRLDELDATLGVFEKADRDIVEDAGEIVSRLVPVSVCADTSRLRDVQALPDDPEQRAEVKAAYRELAALSAQHGAGRGAASLVEAVALVEHATAIGHAPLLAESQMLLGSLYMASGSFDKAHEMFDRAAITAAAAGDDHVIAQTYTEILDLLGRYEARYEDALLFAGPAEASIARAGGSRGASLQFLLLRGNAYLGLGRYEDARRDYQAALDAVIDQPGQLPQKAAATNNLGAVDFTTGDYTRARARFEQALAFRREFQGDLHPDVAECLYNIGNTYLEVGDVENAIPRYREALDVLRLVDSGATPSEAGLRNSLAVAYFANGRLEEARREAELSNEQFRALLGPDNPARIAPQLVIAQLDVLDGHRDRALTSLTKLVEDMRASLGPEHPHVGLPLSQLGRMHLEAGDRVVARKELESAITIIEGLGTSHGFLIPPLTDLGKLEQAEGNRARARELLERAVAIAHRGVNDRWEAANAAFALARLLVDEDKERALGLARDARKNLEGVKGRLSPTPREVDDFIARQDD